MGIANNVVEGAPGNDVSAASSVTINGLEHDQYQIFLGICGEDPLELFNIREEEEFDEDDAGFDFNFCNNGNVSLVDVEDKWTSPIWMSVFDVAEVGRVTFDESEWKKQVRKGRPTKNNINPYGKHAMEGTALVSGKGSKLTIFWGKCYLDSCASYHTLFSEEFLIYIKESNATMTGRCNACTTVTKITGTYGD